MKITAIDAIPISIPFSYGGAPYGFGGQSWTHLDTVLVRVETDTGHVGWGDAFAYGCRRAVTAAVTDMVAPLAVGQDASDINGLMHMLQQRMHLFGRYGITIFALSGLDIALWDIAGKVADLPLCRLLGGAGTEPLPAYASLFRYGDAENVAEYTRAALDEGYQFIKLHEIAEAEVAAARETAGEGVPIMVDTNCPWSPAQAREMAALLKPYDLAWLEEPIFPPEDFAALSALQQQSGVPVAAGENACTAHEFAKMFAAKAVTFAQPSVTKVGGITEVRKIAALAELHQISVVPHCPYFGPGFLASLHLTAALLPDGLVERFYVEPEAALYGDFINPQEGTYSLPSGPGLGIDPDPDVIKDFRAD